MTIPSIVNFLPHETVPREYISIPRNVRLADPDFHKPKEVDMLIGSGPTLSLLCLGQINLSSNLYLHKTRLGWIIAGDLQTKQPERNVCLMTDTEFDIA